jgi:hypothetical protein
MRKCYSGSRCFSPMACDSFGYCRETNHVVDRMLKDDPDLNLYTLAFENPELEDAALRLAMELALKGLGPWR